MYVIKIGYFQITCDMRMKNDDNINSNFYDYMLRESSDRTT